MHNEEAVENSAATPTETEKKPSNQKSAVREESENDSEISLKASAEREEESTPERATTEEEVSAREIPPHENDKSQETAAEIKAGENAGLRFGEVSEDSPEKILDSADVSPENEEAARRESPIFKELAAPQLPRRAPENRARLQIQSPNRVFFYWSIKNDPYRTLQRALGNQTQNYRLVARLVNLENEREEIYPVEPEGSRWFDVESSAAFRAEVGFHASARPFVRLVFSNAVETPRAEPSPNLDSSPAFAVSATDFAEALDASGYRQDAFDVVLAGDDVRSADEATNIAFGRIAGNVFEPEKFDAAELRHVSYALAVGTQLEDLRAAMTPLLFDYLVNILEEQPDALDAENVLPVWESAFGSEHVAEMREQRLSASVFGASLVNFPETFNRRKPKLAPVSSSR